MDSTRFKQIVTTFLDSHDRLDTDRGELAIQLGADVITGTLRTHDGSLFVSEDGFETRAEEWIVNRLAMIPMLADRILTAIPEIATFVTPRGEFLDELDRSPNDATVSVEDAMKTVWEFLNRRPGGTCSVLYLTSDAGEGKTTVIQELARLQAERYKKKEVDWLLVPINLGGKPFLRFDDIVVASLVNQLRFQRLYFDAFIELVRMGVLVPALDGFEEIFIETSEGDAITGLGTLIRHLSGEGALLIAARRAYFEYRSLQTQARLLDSLPDVDVAFGRVGLKRWSHDEFVIYATRSGLKNAEEIYGSVARLLHPNHPLLTRPVLIRRLIEIAQTRDAHFVEELRPRANNYFAWLVETLIAREANEKWIDKHSDPPHPLLSIKEHHELLSYVAEEMWISKTSSLSSEVFDSLAELYCESKGYSPLVSRQVKERLKQHALIVSAGLNRREFAFDHDDFREFFLGEQLATYIEKKSGSDLRKLFRVDTLPSPVLDSAIRRISDGCEDTTPLIGLALAVGLSESSSTYVRENAGALIAPLLCCAHSEVSVDGLVFPPDALKGRDVNKVVFLNCYFRPTSLEHSAIRNCTFSGCEFEHIGFVDGSLHVESCSLADTRVHSLTITREEEMYDCYDPIEISVALRRFGFTIGGKQLELVPEFSVEIDEDLRIAEKALQTFHRSTLVTTGTFKLRLSGRANRFEYQVLPKLLRAGILTEIRGAIAKYKLAVPLASIADALSMCKGSFETFLSLASPKK